MLFFKSNKVSGPVEVRAISTVDMLLEGAREGAFAGLSNSEMIERRKKADREYFKIKGNERRRKARAMGIGVVE